MTELQEKLWLTILNQLDYCAIGSVLKYHFLNRDLKFIKLEVDLFQVSNQ